MIGVYSHAISSRPSRLRSWTLLRYTFCTIAIQLARYSEGGKAYVQRSILSTVIGSRLSISCMHLLSLCGRDAEHHVLHVLLVFIKSKHAKKSRISPACPMIWMCTYAWYV